MPELPPRPTPPGISKPALHKPPGYRDPSAPTAAAAHRPPLRKQPLPPSFRPGNNRKYRRRHRRSCGGICCCCLLTLLILLFIVAVVGALSYLYFQPKLPSFHLQYLKVSHFRVSVKPDGTFLDAAAAATVQATNPNGKMAYSYKEGEARVTAVDESGDVALGSDTFPGFRQGRKNSTVVKLAAGVKGVMVDDGVGTRFKSRYQSRDLRFRVEIRTRVGIGGKSDGVELPVRVVCGDVSLKEMGGGALPKCSINLLRWINLN